MHAGADSERTKEGEGEIFQKNFSFDYNSCWREKDGRGGEEEGKRARD